MKYRRTIIGGPGVTVVVPDRSAKKALETEFADDGWHYIALSDLGVKIDPL